MEVTQVKLSDLPKELDVRSTEKWIKSENEGLQSQVSEQNKQIQVYQARLEVLIEEVATLRTDNKE